MKTSKILASVILLIAPLLAVAQIPAQPSVDAAQKKEAVESLSVLLKENYVFPEVADKAAAQIQKQLASGAYDKVADARAFAQALTEDLRAAAKDKHLRVNVAPPGWKPPSKEGTDDAAIRDELRKENFGFFKVEILPGNIGYLEFRSFEAPRFGGPTAVAAMNFLGSCDALIFDVRENGGGEPEMIQLISTYLFKEPTHLNDLYWRKGDRRDQFWTLSYAPGPPLVDVPVYVLTSSRTFSGAEEFTNNLKVLKRATIVGETTGGGANPGEIFAVAPSFLCFVPTGRAVNPTTGTNWEGTGVEPDLKVPASEALDVARLEALRALKAKAKDPKEQAGYDWYIQGAEARRHPASIAPAELAAFAGTYGPRKVWVEEGKLYQQREGRPRVTLVPMTGWTFGGEGVDYVRFTFEKGADGRPGRLVVAYEDGTSEAFARDGK